MDKFIREADNLFPGIKLDAETGKLEFYGKSSPDDVHAFYEPVFEWLEAYCKDPAEKTVMEFFLNYFNTASAKEIFSIMKTLVPLVESGKNARIRWLYDEDDEDLLDAGKDYSLIVEVEFDFVPMNV
jgi:hypothetical protein